MLIITKENNSIKVVGQNNPTYPYSGTLVYPLNSVTVVTDQSDMAVFRSALNNDVLFTGLIDDITIAGSTVTKEDIGTKFGAISNSSSTGGGGTGGGAVDSVNGQTGTVVLTAGDVNAYAKNEVDGLLSAKVGVDVYNRDIPTLATKEELATKANASDLANYLTKNDAQSTYETISGAEGKYQAKLKAGTGIEITSDNTVNVTLDTTIYEVVESLPESEINPNKIYLVLSAASGETNLYTEYLYVNSKWEKIGEYKADVDLTPYLKSSEAASTYATKQELAGEASEREKQDSALGGMIAGETEAREQAITNLTATVQGKLDTATYNSEKATFETTAHAQETYQPKGDYASETLVNNLEGMVTDLQDYYDRLNDETHRLDNVKQDKLVSGTNIKTINSQSLLGEGNIEITVEGGGITDAPNDGKLYGRKSEQWTEVVIPDTSNLATKAELGAKLDTATYNEEKATFALKTEIPDTSDLATKTELTEGLAGKANTSDLSNYLTTTDAQSTYATKSELGAKLDVETYNSDKATFALKSEIPTDYLTDADLTDYLTKEDASDTYREKKIINFNRTNTSNEITSAWANSLNNIGATFQYVSFDEGATYNNVLYCGYRSYDGDGNRKGVGITEIDGKMRSVIFEFSGTNCVATLEDEIDLSNYATTEQLNAKQDALVSGTNIKTINGNSLLGSGDITIEGGGTSYTAGEGIDISEANVISVDSSALNIPTLQTNKNGSTNNYVYSTGNTNSKKTNVMADIFFANDNTYDTLRCYVRYWGNDSKYDSFIAIPNAESNRAGAMSSLDKAKLDTLKSEWFGTQSQFDGLDSKDENTLYFITEE